MGNIDEFATNSRVMGAVKRAVKEASKSTHRQHRHAAVLLNGSTQLSIAHNTGCLHAEAAAINRAWRSGTDGAVMIVIRIMKDQTLGMSKPCTACTSKLILAGIKKVIYSDIDGSIKSLKLQLTQEVKIPKLKFRTIMWLKQKSKKVISHDLLSRQ